MDGKETTPLLKIIVIGAFLVGLVFAGMGIWLVILGSEGEVNSEFFGQTIKTTNVGIAAILIGALTIVSLLRRVLETVDLSIGRQSSQYSQNNENILNNAWPNTKTGETLSQALLELSETQRKLVRLLSGMFGGVAGGWSQEEIAREIQIDEGEVHYRLRDLERLQLVEQSIRTLGVVYTLPSDVELLIKGYPIVQNVLEPSHHSGQQTHLSDAKSVSDEGAK